MLFISIEELEKFLSVELQKERQSEVYVRSEQLLINKFTQGMVSKQISGIFHKRGERSDMGRSSTKKKRRKNLPTLS